MQSQITAETLTGWQSKVWRSHSLKYLTPYGNYSHNKISDTFQREIKQSLWIVNKEKGSLSLFFEVGSLSKFIIKHWMLTSENVFCTFHSFGYNNKSNKNQESLLTNWLP